MTLLVSIMVGACLSPQSVVLATGTLSLEKKLFARRLSLTHEFQQNWPSLCSYAKVAYTCIAKSTIEDAQVLFGFAAMEIDGGHFRYLKIRSTAILLGFHSNGRFSHMSLSPLARIESRRLWATQKRLQGLWSVALLNLVPMHLGQQFKLDHSNHFLFDSDVVILNGGLLSVCYLYTVENTPLMPRITIFYPRSQDMNWHNKNAIIRPRWYFLPLSNNHIILLEFDLTSTIEIRVSFLTRLSKSKHGAILADRGDR